MEPFTIRYDAARNVVEATFHGRWTLAQAEAWRKEADRVQSGLKPGYTMIVDMTDHPPQSQEVKAIHDASMAETIGHGPVKVVAIIPSSVLSMQMKRSASAAGVAHMFHFFTSRDEALRAAQVAA